MHELRVASLATHPTFLSSMLKSLPYYEHARKYFSREALEEIRRNREQEEDSLEGDETDYGFDERLRVDEIGRLLEGQEHHVSPRFPHAALHATGTEDPYSSVGFPQMRDFLHPEVLPGSYVWADILLYESVRNPPQHPPPLAPRHATAVRKADTSDSAALLATDSSVHITASAAVNSPDAGVLWTGPPSPALAFTLLERTPASFTGRFVLIFLSLSLCSHESEPNCQRAGQGGVMLFRDPCIHFDRSRDKNDPGRRERANAVG